MNDNENIPSEGPIGTTFEYTNGTSIPHLMTVDCGEFGTIEFTVPIGAKWRLTLGTTVPRIVIDDVEIDVLNGDNVVRLKNPD